MTGLLAVLLASLATHNGHPVVSEFATTGTVTFVTPSRSFTLMGANGIDYVFNDLPGRENAPLAGDVVALSGIVERGTDRRENMVALTCSVLRHDTPPPPEDVPLAEISVERHLYHNIRTTGRLVWAWKDDIDPQYVHLTLKSGVHLLHASLFADPRTELPVGATVRITGNYLQNLGGNRLYYAPYVLLNGLSALEVLTPPEDPFAVPALEFTPYINPSAILQMDRRHVEGLVTAAWNGDRFLLRTEDGRDVQITLAKPTQLPAVGSFVRAAGYPDTDLFRINLIYADCRPCDRLPLAPDTPRRISAATIFRNHDGQTKYNAPLHGQLLTLRGDVHSLSATDGQFTLSADGFLIPVLTTAAADGLADGAQVEVTGICLMEADSWRPNLILPQINRVFLVTRSAADIRVLAPPPWWTPARFLALISTLVVVLVAILIWNRLLNRLVERRSRQLFREQVARSTTELKVDERTRLAVELHDTLSQKLAGVAYQVASLHKALAANPEATTRLQTAEQMLSSCRTELRHCLFDLRSDMLEVRDFAAGIRTSINELGMSATVDVDFPVDRARLHDATAHAIICIVRELVANAWRHGHATAISVKGAFTDASLVFTVTDNGDGFDATRHPGVPDGHFGLHGIGERVKRLRGTFRIESAPGRGTTATCELPATKPGTKDLS